MSAIDRVAEILIEIIKRNSNDLRILQSINERTTDRRTIIGDTAQRLQGPEIRRALLSKVEVLEKAFQLATLQEKREILQLLSKGITIMNGELKVAGCLEGIGGASMIK